MVCMAQAGSTGVDVHKKAGRMGFGGGGGGVGRM